MGDSQYGYLIVSSLTSVYAYDSYYVISIAFLSLNIMKEHLDQAHFSFIS